MKQELSSRQGWRSRGAQGHKSGPVLSTGQCKSLPRGLLHSHDTSPRQAELQTPRLAQTKPPRLLQQSRVRNSQAVLVAFSTAPGRAVQ